MGDGSQTQGSGADPTQDGSELRLCHSLDMWANRRPFWPSLYKRGGGRDRNSVVWRVNPKRTRRTVSAM